MSCHRRTAIPAILAATLLLCAAAAATSPPEAVSPGEAGRVAPVEHRCPTFSWTEAEGALAYQLVAYVLPADPAADVELAPGTEVLVRRLPPRATSWTPPADTCFAPGGAFVWFVRAVLLEEDGIVTDASDWSEGLYFAVPAAVGLEGGDGARERARTPREARRLLGGGGGQARAASSRSVPTAPAAVRGDAPDTTGEVYGVLGSTASPDGAGLAAANTGGGADLVLDGSADGGYDARITESGLDRTAPSNQAFTMTNSGAGDLIVTVDRITGNGSGLTALDASNLAAGTLPSDRFSGTYSSAVSLSNTHNQIAGTHAGNGAGLTSLNASNLASGTVPGARLAGTYANALTLSNASNSLTGTHSGSGAGLTSLNASNLASGTVPSARLSGTYSSALTLSHASNSFTGTFTGDGAGLTGVTATTVDGLAPGAMLPGSAWGQYDASVVDPSVDVRGSSIAIGSDGLGFITYGTGGGYVGVAHCEDLLCSTVSRRHISSGLEPSVSIGGDGLPMIAYDYFGLRVAHCDDPQCTTADLTIVPSVAGITRRPSIATGTDGYGIISYHAESTGALEVVHCTNQLCSSSVVSVIDDGEGTVGSYSSITIGADGLPLIAYSSTEAGLKVAHCGNSHCTSFVSTVVDTSPGYSCSITIGSDGRGLASYLGDGDSLRVAHCSDLSCSAASTAILDSGLNHVNPMYQTSVTIGSDGRGVVSYWDGSTDNLKVAHCDDDACSTATTIDAKISGMVGTYSSITLGADGLPLVVYSYMDGDQLLVTHCSNRFCVPKARMR